MPSSSTSRAVGRPSFRVDPDRLRGLRDERQLTQAQAIEQAHRHLGRLATSSAVKHYQRIERTGKTSRSMAAALAAVLGTSVAVLQGEAPQDEGDQFIDRLEQQLAHQIAGRSNPSLVEHLARYGDASPRELAVELAGQVEAAMFDRRDDELEELARLTGWTVDELMQPVVVHGHWMLVSSTSLSVAEVVMGVGEVIWHISQAAEKHANFRESDTSISLREALPRLHVVIQHPRVPALRRKFSFMRCLPSPSGLKWVNPSWRDRLQLDDGLRDWAYTAANFVTDFDGKVRPGDVRRLRLKVNEFDAASRAWRHVALIRGNLDELPARSLENFRKEGTSHQVALSWIVGDGSREIAALLAEWPLNCWKISSSLSAIGIDLNAPARDVISRGQELGPRYAIHLVEELPDGQIHPVPWRTSSVKETCEDLKRCLGIPPD